MGPRTPRPRAAAVALVLTAGALGGCGGGDGGGDATPLVPAAEVADIPGGGPPPRTATVPVPKPLPGDSGGTGAAPAGDPAAIRLALRRSPSGLVAAKTARFGFEIRNGPSLTTGSGTADLRDHRYLAVQRSGRSPALRIFGEEGRSFLESAPGKSWSVADDPSASNDPLSLVRLLPRATVVRVGAVAQQGGGTCRTFVGTLPVTALLTEVRPQDVEDLIGEGREKATVPISACVDDRGRAFSVDQSFVWARTFGGTLGKSPGSSITRIRVSDYGTAPAPRRPLGASIAGPATGTIQGPG